MFDRSAELYDAFYDALGKDYEGEARSLHERIGVLRPQAATLLDVACGTGRHLEYLSRTLMCVGLDINPGLLAVARRRCPNVTFVEADMTEFDLGLRFDAVTCLFSSIGYVVTERRLTDAVLHMARHLNPGGVLVVEPWFRPEQWTEGRVQVLQAERDGHASVRMMVSRREGDVAVLDTHYLHNGPSHVEHRAERHELGLFSWEQYLAAFEAARLSTEVDPIGPTGRGLIVGVAS